MWGRLLVSKTKIVTLRAGPSNPSRKNVPSQMLADEPTLQAFPFASGEIRSGVGLSARKKTSEGAGEGGWDQTSPGPSPSEAFFLSPVLLPNEFYLNRIWENHLKTIFHGPNEDWAQEEDSQMKRCSSGIFDFQGTKKGVVQGYFDPLKGTKNGIIRNRIIWQCR